jgi:hypothetical protein
LDFYIRVEAAEQVDVDGVHDPSELAGAQVPLPDLVQGPPHKGGDSRFGKNPDFFRNASPRRGILSKNLPGKN